MIHALMDFIGLIGLGMLGYGLYCIHPVLMFCIIGTVFVAFALFGSSGHIMIRKKEKKG